MIASAFAGCSKAPASEYKDGTYRAEAAEFSHGWKEYVEITIADGKISAVEVDAFKEDDADARKSKDPDYKTAMVEGNKANGVAETYPEEFYKKLADSIMAGEVETVAGATHSSDSVKVMAEAALANAKEGKTETAVVA